MLSFTQISQSANNINIEEEFKKRLVSIGYDLDTYPKGITLKSLEETEKDIGFSKGAGSIKIDYFDLKGNPTGFSRWRHIGAFTGPKYHQQKGTGCRCFIPFYENGLERLNDVDDPLLITEGEFKSIRAAKEGYLTIGLGGVDSISEQDGNDNRRLIYPLNILPLNKKVVILFDFDPDGSNEDTNEPKLEVLKAEARLAALLTIRGCKVHLGRLGSRETRVKVGLDDYLNAFSIKAFEKVLDDAKLFDTSHLSGGLYSLLARYAVLSGDVVSVKTFETFTASKFKNQVANTNNEKPDGPPPSAQFLNSQYRLTLLGADYKPEFNMLITPDNKLNLWRGFKTKPVKGSVKLWEDFTDLFFSNEPELRHHFESVFALMFQKPWVKQNRLCILKSGSQGIGKSFYFETMAAIVNGSIKGAPSGTPFDHALVSSGNSLESSFNSMLGGRSLVVFNEIGERGEKHTNLIKDLVTSSTLVINEKYKKEVSVENKVLFCITTNEAFTHLVEEDSRRELIYSIPKRSKLVLELVNLFDRNKDLTTWVNSPIGRSSLLDYYLNYDIGEYNGSQPAPSSIGKIEMAEAAKASNDLNIYVDDDLRDVHYIIPKLEISKLETEYPRARANVAMLTKYCLDSGNFKKGLWDKVNSQLKFGEDMAKEHDALIRPKVLVNANIGHLYNESKEKIFEYVYNRYYKVGGSKL